MSTRISDLPELPDSQAGGYMPVHPNPYGNPPPQTAALEMRPPQVPTMREGSHRQAQPPKITSMFPDQTRAAQYMQQQQQMPLPSRDMPMDMSHLTNDIETTANYVPPPKHKNYIAATDDDETELRQKKKRKDRRARMAEDLFDMLQRPMILGLIFFLFQMPALNGFIHRNMPFLNMYNGEGGITTWGITIKSVLFGIIVYSLDTMMEIISDI